MQSSKNRNGSSDVSQKPSHMTPSKLKMPASESESVLSPNRASRTSKDKSPKVIGRRSPRSPAAEKIRTSKASELESQLSQLQEELKKTKDQLSSSESTAKKAYEEVEKAKNDVATMSAKLAASQILLVEPSFSEEDQVGQLKGAQNENSSDLNNLQLELTETLSLVETLKSQLSVCKESESRAMQLLTDTQVKLEMAKTVEENLRAEGLEAEKAYMSVVLELENLKTQDEGECDGSYKLKSELFEAKAEIKKLKSALDLAEIRCQEESIQNTLLMRTSNEQEEHAKAELAIREVEMGAELERAKAEIEELKAEIPDCKKTKNGHIIKIDMEKMRDENKALMAEMQRREEERKREIEETAALIESARVSERETLMKIGYLTEEADKSNRKAARVVEQLEAVQGTNAEMESELRMLKVQSDQWRKAAEAAAAMISSGHNNDKLVERTGSFDKGYTTLGSKLGSPFSEDFNDESPKKKNGSMLRKLSILLKKGQK